MIDDDSKESGTLVMKKVSATQVEAKIDFSQPNPRTALFQGRQAQVYYPKTKTLQIYDLGNKGDQVDRFVMLGFGTSGKELANDYAMRIAGQDTVAGKSTSKLELIPKAPDIKKLVSKIEMWIPDAPAQPYPVQEKIYEPSGDYRVTAYSNFKLNPPLSSDALKLKLPKGVNVEHPQK
ncbi:MAG: hypothetical protein JO022_09275 [Acidobacteriaceae bacterium]|nr:hypothetical protein [Acidobacteriaceae bacterium]